MSKSNFKTEKTHRLYENACMSQPVPAGIQDNSDVKRALKRIEYLKGADEFKDYIKELEAMRPILAKWNGIDDFPSRHLLFAINPGNGCSTILENFQDYISSSGLYYGADKENSRSSLAEMTLEYNDHATIIMKDVFEEFESDIYQYTPGIIGIHIDEWLDKLDSPYFVDLLKYCEVLRHRNIYVFIVPYLEEEMLSRVQRVLNDILNVRLIHFPEYTDDELAETVAENLLEFGIKVDPSADKYLKHMIIKEKSDGKFYGMQSMKKITTELALLKAGHSSSPDMLTQEDFNEIIDDDYFSSSISGYERFDSLIGMQDIKKSVEEMVLSIKAQKQLNIEGFDDEKPCYHMMFTGNPGTGKTEVARIIGRIFRENGLLSVGDMLEVSRFDLVGEYIGQTGPKTVALCKSAMGSVMFIDEAYLLASGRNLSNNRDYGVEAIGALIAEMENSRDKFIVILAGYKDEMEKLCEINPGLAARIPYRLHFENYTREGLFDIFKTMIKDKYIYDESFLSKAEAYFKKLPDELMASKEFGNARFVRNLVERIRIKAVIRMTEKEVEGIKKIEFLPSDFDNAVSDKDIKNLNKKGRKTRIGYITD